MANSLTDTITDVVGKQLATVKTKVVSFDTDAEFELEAAVSGTTWYVLALNYGVTSAHNVKVYSDSAVKYLYNHGAGVASKDSLAGGAFAQTEPGASLGVSISVAGTLTVSYTSDQKLAYGGI